MSELLEKEVQLHERDAQGRDWLVYPLPPGGYPLTVDSGGTGSTDAASARGALGITPTNIGAATSEHNHAITDLIGTIPVTKGGTGAVDSAGARTNLGVTLANLGAAASNHAHVLADAQVTGILPVSKGGTGSSNPTEAAASLLFLGMNPDFEDTVTNWSARGFGWAWCTSDGTPSVAEKPASFGFLLNVPVPVTGAAETHQLFFSQNHGPVWHRGGNGSGWGGTWKRMFDNTDVLGLANGGTGQTTAAGIRNTIGLGSSTGALAIANGGHGGTTLAQAQSNLGFALSSTTTPAVSPVVGTIDYFRLYKVGKVVTFNMRYSSAIASGANTEAAIIPSAYRPVDPYVPLTPYYGNTITINAYTTNAGILMIRPSANINNLALSGSWVIA